MNEEEGGDGRDVVKRSGRCGGDVLKKGRKSVGTRKGEERPERTDSSDCVVSSPVLP
jgi:hypothetical protein